MAKPSLDKQKFFEDLGYTPHPGQLEIHLATEPRRVVACGVRWGKTVCAAMEGLAAAMQPNKKGSIGWVVGPTYDLADRVFLEIRLRALEHLKHRIIAVKESERRILLRNLAGGISEIRGKSADSEVSLLGEGLDWVILDEASRLRPRVWQEHISQRLIDKKGWALLISTPKGKGYYYDLFRRGQGGDPDWRSWNCPSWGNPLLERDIIERERARLPERVFRQEYEAEFIEGSGAVFRYVRDAATGAFAEQQEGRRYFAGLDLAKIEDYTVLTVIDDKRNLVLADRFQRLDWPIQVQRIKAALERYGNPEVYVDTTGAGEPVYEQLLRADIRALAYPFTQKTKAALIDNRAMLFEQKSITIPRPEVWPEGIDELEAFEFSVTDAGNVRTGAPGGYHDDIVISLALAAWHRRLRYEPDEIICAPILFIDGVQQNETFAVTVRRQHDDD
jgi:hypothetical protein